MRRNDDISHSGVIKSVGRDIIEVEIVSESACASCHAASLCTAAEAVKKSVQVPADPRETYAVGEQVDVLLKKSMGGKAVLLAYVAPLFILMILVVSLCHFGVSEPVAAAIGVGGIAVWYLFIYLIRDRIAGQYIFYIRRK